MPEERSYPQIGDTLFQGERDLRLNADISVWNNHLSGYAAGYKFAADGIVDAAIAGNKPFTFYVSNLVFPVVFLYRQYIELRVKQVILLGSRMKREQHGFPKHHRIDEIWNHACPYLEGLPGVPHDSLVALGTCLDEFCKLDPDGMAFRYPGDRDGKPHLPEWTVINLRHLAETMTRIGHLLDDGTDYLLMDLQHQNEFANEKVAQVPLGFSLGSCR